MSIPSRKKRFNIRAAKHAGRKAISRAALIERLEKRQLLTATWTALTNAAPSGIEAMVLLSNGDVMGQNYGNNDWYVLTPSSTGSYLNGTWSKLANAPDSRTYYSTQTLENGNIFIAGGEYGTGGATGAVYNYVTNTWTPIPTGVGSYLDAASEILANGTVLETPVYPATSGKSYLYNPTTNTWTTGPTLYRGSDTDEQNWVKLADGTILMPDGKYTSERYIPSSNTFVNDGTTTVAQTDSEGEFGQGVLLPNGKAFYVGTGSTTEIYTPSGYNSATGIYSPNGTTPGTWAAGPTLPGTLGTDDAPIARLPDGNVLFTVGPIDSYSGGNNFYIYNYANNTIALSPGAPTETDPPYVNRFLDLPDGTVLMSVDGATLYDYNDGGTTLTAPTPTISTIVQNSDGSYLLTGTQLTGDSEGAYYGDDAQMNSNYPIVRLTSTSSGTVYFARTFNWSTTNVDTGTTPVTTDFTIPLGLPAGTYTLDVMVNGFVSANYAFTNPTAGDIQPIVSTNASASPSPVTGTTTTLSVAATGSSALTYYWKNTTNSPSTNSTASFNINGTNTSNSVTATFQQAGTYTFVVTITDMLGLSNTSSVSVTVGQTLSSLIVTPASPNLTVGQTQQLTATAYDQFGNAMTTQPTFTWSLTSGLGTLSSTGLYTTSAGTLAVVKATTGAVSASTSLYVVDSPWVSADIGSPGVAGTAFDTSGTFNVSGSGLDVWNTEDHFHYVYQALGGNGEMTVEVATEPEQTTGWEKAGVMIRSTLDESSQQADISVTPGNGIAFQYRNTSAGSSANVNGGSETAPYWVRIVRNGNLFTGYYSANGTTWTAEGSATIVMAGPAYIGMFLTSQSDTVADTVTFTNVSLLDAAPQTLTVTAGIPGSVNVLTGDTGPSGSTLSLTGVTQGTKGSVTFNASGGVTYNSSNTTVSGPDTFIYTISDGLGDTATGTVTVNILGLQAYYHFNEDTGTTSADATGDGYTATLSGATWGAGVDGSYALAMSGTSEYASIPALNLNSNTVTMSAWIDDSGTETADAGIVFNRDSSGSNGQGLDFYNTTKLGYTWGSSSATYGFSTGPTPTVGVWTFVALVISPGSAVIYMEPLGGTMTSATSTLSLPAEAFSTVTGIGEDPTYTTRDYTGSIDEVRIYNTNLSAGQIAAIANLSPTIPILAAASPNPVTGSNTALSVQGNDYEGASVLSYSWAATNIPSGATTPTFSVNGTNAANDTTATFHKIGTYVFTVTISDGHGLTNTSNVSVAVAAGSPTIAITPSSVSLGSADSQKFTAVEDDQFGNALTTQPTFTWSSTGSGSINSSTGVYTAGYASGSATVIATAGTVTQTASVTITNAAPIINSGPSASPSTVSGSSVGLSVSATDDGGADLTYTWSTTGTPPATPNFTVNGSNTSSSTTAAFTKAGTYTFQVLVADAGGLSTTSNSVTVVVTQTLTSVVVSPASTNLQENGTQTFTAMGYDQFGNALTTQPAFTWSQTAGAGSINSSTGVYTAPGSPGTATIQATTGSLTSSPTSITISNAAPTISPASATPASVTGTTTTLSALGADDGGESNLTYTWTATPPSGAASPTYSSNGVNASKTTTATFTQTGIYAFTVTATDAQGLTTSSGVTVTVTPTTTSIAVSPATVAVAESTTQAFTAIAFDQFGNAMSPQPTLSYSRSGVGSINSSTGVYTAPPVTGTATITAASGSVSGTATVSVVYGGPTIHTPAAATPSSVTGTTTALSVLGSEPAGESNLVYTWSETSVPANAKTPTFSFNGTNAAKNTTATFFMAGTYTFTVLVTDASSSNVSSSVTVAVSQTLTGVTLASNSVITGATDQATGVDQFGNALASSPAWSLSGGGSINSAGLFTAGSTGGTFNITATQGTVVSSSVTVVPTSYSGSTGSDTYAIRLSPTSSTTEQIFVNTSETGSPTYSIATSQLTSLSFTPASDGALTLDYSNGNPLPAQGISYSGGNTLYIEGASAGGTAFNINATKITNSSALSSPITYSNLQNVEFDLLGGTNTLTQSAQPTAAVTYNAGPGDNTLNVNGGSFTFSNDPALGSGSLTVNDNSAVVFTAAPNGGGYATRNLSALNLGSSATALLAASTTTTDRIVLETSQLTITAGGKLDIANNAMVIHGGNITTVSNLIKVGAGIISSSAASDTTLLTTIGVMSNNNSGGTFTSSFDNQPVTAGDVLLKDTFFGDTNLDGKVDGSDYSRIDNAALSGTTGWFNGDFNYDGQVDGSDYTLIDNAYNTQGAELPVTAPTTVPTPTAYYKFNDGLSTTVTDSTGDGFNGTNHGATLSTGVDASTGLTFNGTSSYVSLPALNLNSNAVTLSGWIDRNGNQSTGTGLIFNRNGATGNGLTIGTDNRLAYSWGTSGSTFNFNSDLVVPNGQWTFVALVVTSKNATLYMQPQGGEMSSATSNVANPVEPFNTATDIGQDSQGGQFFKGSMDEVQIFDSALNTAEILTIADLAPVIVSPAATIPSPLVAYQAALSVQAISQAGAANLTYTWATTTAPEGAVVKFSANGTASAYSTTVTGNVPGTYVFTVTVSDPGHLSATSSVSQTFDINPFDIAEINYPQSPVGKGVQPLQLGDMYIDSVTPVEFYYNQNPVDRWVLIFNSLTIVGPVSQLDLGNNDMIIHSANATAAAQTLANITNYVNSGYGQGGAFNWTYGGIISSVAADDGLGRSAITVMLNINAQGKPIYTTFDGQAVTTTDVLVKYNG